MYCHGHVLHSRQSDNGLFEASSFIRIVIEFMLIYLICSELLMLLMVWLKVLSLVLFCLEDAIFRLFLCSVFPKIILLIAWYVFFVLWICFFIMFLVVAIDEHMVEAYSSFGFVIAFYVANKSGIYLFFNIIASKST